VLMTFTKENTDDRLGAPLDAAGGSLLSGGSRLNGSKRNSDTVRVHWEMII